VRQLVDVRIHNTSQLAGFAKRDDLAYFLKTVVGAEYVHEARLAPTSELLRSYRTKAIGWSEYEVLFLGLMEARQVELVLDLSSWEALPTVLLCTEKSPARCHRRLVLEYLRSRVSHELEPVHL
jgi:uncharacterized protein (DUF488 family)